MSAAVAVRYEDDTENPVATVTVVHIEATDLTVNETQTSEGITDEVPPAPITYYLSAEHDDDDHDDLVSVRFQGPDFTWDNVIFSVDGVWSIHVREDDGDASVVDINVTVDAAS